MNSTSGAMAIPYAQGSGGGTTCAVIGCTYNARKLHTVLNTYCFDHKDQLRKDCVCDPPYCFYRPKNAEDRREWLAKLLLKQPPKNLAVCSFHFIDHKPTEENPCPEKNLGVLIFYKYCSSSSHCLI